MRVRLGLAMGTLVAGMMLAGWGAGWLGDLADQTLDVRFDVRGDEPPPAELLVVGVDDRTFQELGLQWPFPRSLHARAIERLARAGARVIAYDVQFTEQSTSVVDDNALIRAIDRADNVVLSTTEVADGGQTGVLGGGELLGRIGAPVGNALIEPGDRGPIRRLPLAVEGLPSFSLAAAELALGRSIGAAEAGSSAPLIRFAGGPGTIPSLSFVDVVEGRFADEAVRGKIVVVGAVASSLQDLHPTSTTGRTLMAGPEIAAHAIATALDGFLLRPAPRPLDAALIALLAFAAPLAGVRLGLRWVLACGLALAAGAVVAAQLAFQAGTVLAVVYQLGAIVLGTVAALGVFYHVEAVERERTRGAFGRFVPDSVVERLLAGGDGEQRVPAERLLASVLFADLRGFTGFAETVAPETVVRVLDRYLQLMTNAIHDAGGTVASFQGDGIMAVFGAPLPRDDHAVAAVAAARAMLGPQLDEFNGWLAAEGLAEGFRMGIGIASGPVMSGTIGSQRRLEYAAVGATTNLAARLQDLTKQTGAQLLVADATREALAGADDLPLVDAGLHAVRGTAPQRVWAIAGPATD